MSILYRLNVGQLGALDDDGVSIPVLMEYGINYFVIDHEYPN